MHMKNKRNKLIGYAVLVVPLLLLPLAVKSRADMGLYCCSISSLWASTSPWA